MSWSQPADLRAQAQKLWDKGEILTALVTGEALFPKRLALKTPSSADMSERFDDVRSWITGLNGLKYCRVVRREFKHRVLGVNSVPAEIWLDSLEDAVAFIAKRRELKRFVELLDETRLRRPALLPWLAKRPLRALELNEDWTRLLAIVDWLERHLRPGVYLRQVDVPGVHSKFIEAQRGVLSEWLDLCLPAEAIDTATTGAAGFARRYGFCDKPQRVRFRLLDERHALALRLPGLDLTLNAGDFAGLDPKVERVFVTENEINFLAFPALENSLVIFGSGYGFDPLIGADWLDGVELHYWGDIDTHGFAMLDQLRARFAGAKSLLMDKATLMAHTALWGEEAKQTLRDLPRLTADERALYDDLRDNRIQKQLRLEQERIGYGWLMSALTGLG